MKKGLVATVMSDAVLACSKINARAFKKSMYSIPGTKSLGSSPRRSYEKALFPFFPIK